MAQQVIPATQLVPRYHTIGRCNNYVMLQSIPCSPECKIVGQILLDHPLSYALTATADVPVEFTYTVDMFQVTFHLPVETPENPFVAPVNIQTIEVFMNMVGYQEEEAIQYPRFIKLIIANLMKKFPDIPQRVYEDYHSIKDDTPLVSVYTNGNVLVRGMLIPDVFLTEEIRATNDFIEYKTVFVGVDVSMNQLQPMVEGEKDDDDSEDRLEPRSHKENLKYVDDADDKEKVDEEKDVDTGSLETRTEEMQTPIPTPPRSPRINLSWDKNITQELTDINMERKCVTTKYFWKTHKKVDRVLHEIVPQLAEKATDDLIENSLKPSIAATIIKDHDAFRSKVPDLLKISQLMYPSNNNNNNNRNGMHGVEEIVIDDDEVIPEDETPELITELQNVDKDVPTILSCKKEGYTE
ncbi:hypothetical protein Tco_1235694 [Tanacetum coccineum]